MSKTTPISALSRSTGRRPPHRATRRHSVGSPSGGEHAEFDDPQSVALNRTVHETRDAQTRSKVGGAGNTHSTMEQQLHHGGSATEAGDAKASRREESEFGDANTARRSGSAELFVIG